MEKIVQNIVVGSLLGDGWLRKLCRGTGTSIYAVKYNDKTIGYLEWLRDQVIELGPSLLKEKPGYSQHYFYTRARTDIGNLRKIFYPSEGKKVVPENIDELLTDPIGLAIWYQDDGTLDRRSKYHWNIRIATYCFSYEDCTRLKETVQRNFGIEVSVCKCQMRQKMYYQLYVPSKSMERFIETVRPYIHQDFAYKILAKVSQGQQQR